MKPAVRSLILLAVLGSTLANAQNPIPFKHVVIIFQENRTPDNLFGSGPVEHLGCGYADPFELGVDIDNGGPNKKAGQPTLTPVSSLQ